MQHTLTKRLEICIIDINIAINEVDHYTYTWIFTYIFTYLIFRLALEILAAFYLKVWSCRFK